MKCIPAGMEFFPAADEEQFKYIKRIIDDCDYYLLVIAGRYGSTTADGTSYTEREFDYAVDRDIPVLVFPHAKPETLRVEQSERDPTMVEKLNAFRDRACTGRMMKSWTSADDLAGRVVLSLMATIDASPRPGWVRGPVPDATSLLQQINDLRVRNEELERNAVSGPPPVTIDTAALAKGNETIMLAVGGLGLPRDTMVAVSWDEILRWIGPDLLQWVSDTAVQSTLAKAIMFYKKDRSDPMAYMSDTQFKTVRIQMMALGYTDVQSLNTTAGTPALFWRLTEAGKKRMLELAVVKAGAAAL